MRQFRLDSIDLNISGSKYSLKRKNLRSTKVKVKTTKKSIEYSLGEIEYSDPFRNKRAIRSHQTQDDE